MSKTKGTGFDAKKYVKDGVTLEQVQEIKQSFDAFDSEDGGGSLDMKQLKAAMICLGYDTKNSSIFQMITDLDTDGNRSLDFSQWMTLMTTKIGQKNSRDHYRKVFAMYDHQKTGNLTAKNLRKVAEDLGQTIEDWEIQEIIRRTDQNNDGLVSEQEFYNIMSRKFIGQNHL